MKIYEIKNGKKEKVEVKKTKKSPKKRPTETKSQKSKRIWNEIRGMFGNYGRKV